MASRLFLTVVLVVLGAVGAVHATAVSSPCQPLTWQESTDPDDYYHFHGFLEFCQQTLPDGTSYFQGYRDLSISNGPCCSPGPTISLIPGYNYKATLRNGAAELTNIHTHGVHLMGIGNGDDITRTVAHGECLGYNWTIPGDHNGMLSCS
jgi:FtsP/CotA-like multicopper oxidase with cupredoxin domain